MINDSVAFLRAEGKRVIYDAEHFFDGFRDDPDYALRVPAAAAEGAPRPSSLCDTNGATLPHQIAAATASVVDELRGHARRHPHPRRRECGVANSLAAVEAGATHVQGTVNGYGERTGNANLITILANLQLKMGYRGAPGRAAHAPDRDRAPDRRDLQHAARSAAVRRPQRLRPQGRDARRRHARRRVDLRAHRSRAGRQRSQPPDLRARPAGDRR